MNCKQITSRYVLSQFILIISLLLFIAFLTLGLSCNYSVNAQELQTEHYLRDGLSHRVEVLIDDYRKSIPKGMAKNKIPGCVIALIDSDGPIWIYGFGYEDIERKTLVTGDTYFNVGPVSKTILSTAIMLAVKDGLLDLNEPIATYLPDFSVKSKYSTNTEQEITLKHLLNHTSGLVRDIGIPGDNFDQFSNGLAERYIANPVGKKWSYSNAGYDLAAHILQTVSGLSFDQYLKEHLFIPLGMYRSTVNIKCLSNEKTASGYKRGLFGLKVPNRFMSPPIGAGGVYISAVDLAKFVQFHLNKGRVGNIQFLDKELLDEMYAPRTRVADPEVYYGYGIFIKNKTSERSYSLSHNGTWIGGFSAGMCWYHQDDMGIAILTNGYSKSVQKSFIVPMRQKLIRHGLIKSHLSDVQKYP